MKINKLQFKKYISYFNNSFNTVIKRNFYELNDINDISNQNYSIQELNTFSKNKNISLYICKNLKIFSDNIDSKLKYIIFAKIGKYKNVILGSIYLIYDYTENQIIENKNNMKDIAYYNYCISITQLNQMLKF